MKPSVSVIITCYNHARFLGETIESVLGQTHQDFEIVLVDDGSSDETPQVVRDYPRVRYIRQDNQGVVAARMNGFRESGGDHLVFLDGDDRLLPDALATGVAHLSADGGRGFVYGLCRCIAADGAPLPLASPASVEGDQYAALLRRNYIWMPAQVMHRRQAFETIGGFNRAADHSSDLDLYLRLAREFAVHSHREIVAEWRQHEGNTSRRNGLMLKSSLLVMRAQRQFVRRHEQYREAYRSAYKGYQTYYGELLIDDVRDDVRAGGDLRRAATGALTLLRYCPRLFAEHATRKLYCMIVRRKEMDEAK